MAYVTVTIGNAEQAPPDPHYSAYCACSSCEHQRLILQKRAMPRGEGRAGLSVAWQIGWRVASVLGLCVLFAGYGALPGPPWWGGIFAGLFAAASGGSVVGSVFAWRSMRDATRDEDWWGATSFAVLAVAALIVAAALWIPVVHGAFDPEFWMS